MYLKFKTGEGKGLNDAMMEKKCFVKYLKQASTEKVQEISKFRSEIEDADQELSILDRTEDCNDERMQERRKKLLVKKQLIRTHYCTACKAMKDCKANIAKNQTEIISLKNRLMDHFNEWSLCPENRTSDEPMEINQCPSVGARRCHTALMPIIVHRRCAKQGQGVINSATHSPPADNFRSSVEGAMETEARAKVFSSTVSSPFWWKRVDSTSEGGVISTSSSFDAFARRPLNATCRT
jgi:hypothetical protein